MVLARRQPPALACSMHDAVVNGCIMDFARLQTVKAWDDLEIVEQTLVRAVTRMADELIIRAWCSVEARTRGRLAVQMFVLACDHGKVGFAEHLQDTCGPFKDTVSVGGVGGWASVGVYTLCLLRCVINKNFVTHKWLVNTVELPHPKEIRRIFETLYCIRIKR